MSYCKRSRERNSQRFFSHPFFLHSEGARGIFVSGCAGTAHNSSSAIQQGLNSGHVVNFCEWPLWNGSQKFPSRPRVRGTPHVAKVEVTVNLLPSTRPWHIPSRIILAHDVGFPFTHPS